MNAASLPLDPTRAEWQRKAGLWRKWDAKIMAYTAGAADALLQAAAPQPGDHVLDLASGTGEPALTLASMVSPGTVAATDPVPEMLAIAVEKAERLGLKNFLFREAAAESLPFPSARFDLVTCRFGVMYFSDPAQALAEIARVLKPGGRVVFTAWEAAGQPWFQAAQSAFSRYVPPEAIAAAEAEQSPFGTPGALAPLLRQAGFVEVVEEGLEIPCVWPGSAADFWEWYQQSSSALHPIVEAATPAQRQLAAPGIIADLRRFEREGETRFTGFIVRAHGRKPGSRS